MTPNQDEISFNEEFKSLLLNSDSKLDFYKKIKNSKKFNFLSRSFVLMGHSRSLDSKNATPEYPRQINYGGSLAIATVDHPNPKNVDQSHLVEGIAYIKKSSEIMFFTADFSQRPLILDTNPQGCQTCHHGRYN